MRASLLLALILAFTFRALYTVYTGNPYYVDSWPLIAGAKTFSSSPEARVFDDSYYDGYNNRWPYSIVTAGVLSLVTGANPVDVGRLLGPSLGALAVLALYTLASRISDGRRAGLVAVIAACSGTLFAFEGGFTKEVYARPLVLLATLAVLYAWRLPAVVALILAVAFTHHVSTVALAGVLSGILATSYLYEFSRGYTVTPTRRLALALALTLAFQAFQAYLAAPGFWRSSITVGKAASLSLFVTTSLSIAAFALFPSQRVTFKHRAVFASVIGFSAAAMSFIAMASPPTPQTTPLGAYMTLYAAPLVLSPLFAYTARASKEQAVVVGGWLVGLGGLMAYSAFSGDLVAAAAIQRFINYTLYGVLLAYATGPPKLVIAQTVIALAAAPVIAVNILEARDPYYHYNLYTHSEIALAELLLPRASAVYGDSKVSYLAYMYKVKVENPPPALDKLDKPLIVHWENAAKGFWVGGLIYGDVGEIALASLKHNLSYNDGVNKIIAGTGS